MRNIQEVLESMSEEEIKTLWALVAFAEKHDLPESTTVGDFRSDSND